MNAGFRGIDACAVAGITYRQLDHWARTRLVVPEVREAAGSGSQRLYSQRDVTILAVIRLLLRSGVSIAKIRGVVNPLKTRPLEDFASITLMGDGTSVFELQDDEQIVDLIKSGRAVYAIALHGVVRAVETALADLHAEVAP